jgi:predicted dehydrogenase
MSNQPENKGTSRREFLRNAAATAAVTAAAAGVAKSSVYSLAPGKVIGANDKINIGHVGIGVQGNTHVRLLKEHKVDNNTNSIAICDLYGRRLAEVGADLGLKDSQKYWDYRKFLENKDIDAVWVATSDNWHAPIAMAAMEAGKHVYCEKPMCKTLEEAFAIYDTVKRTKRTFQIGSQGCTDQKWHVAGKMVKDGKIGHVVVGQGSYMRNGRVGEWNNYGRFDKDAGPTASGDAKVDWETFRKGTEPKTWDPDRFFRWRKYWEYGSGLVGDLFPHRLHPLFIAMNIPMEGLTGFPLRVSSGGGLYVQKINPETGKMDREVPDFTNISVDFGDCSLMAMSSSINEQGWQETVRGNKGTLYFGGNTVELKPERVWADEIDAETQTAPGKGENIEDHEKNFLDCIRNPSMVPNANIDLAVRVQTMITLGELAYRYNTTFTFDPKTRKATPDASKYRAD